MDATAHPSLGPLKARFPQSGLRVAQFREMTWVLVPREILVEVCTFLRDTPELEYDYLCELNGVDYLDYPEGTEARFAVNYGLVSTKHNRRLWLKVLLNPTKDCPNGQAPPDDNILEVADPGMKVDSVTGVWPGAEWPEREAYDMFGVVFVGHPDLRRLLTWSKFGSYPLRKDYPLRGIGERENYARVTREDV